MMRRIHQKLGTAGFVISIVALVVALGGGAYAASGGLTGKQKKEVEKIAKKYAGKPGATGPAGSAGPAGAKGAAGANGVTGAQGNQGNPGSPGTPGALGAPGKEGSPWVAGGNLPPGSTETGTYASGYHSATEAAGEVYVPISFPIPLAAANTAAKAAIYMSEKRVEEEENEEVEPSGCEGSVANPTAPEGVLCIYPSSEQEEGVRFLGFALNEQEGYQRSGAVMLFFGTAAPANLVVSGTYAVTAPKS